MKIIRTGHWCTEDVKTARSYPSPLQIPSDNEEAAEFLFSLLSSTAHSVLVAAILCLKALAEVYSHHTVKEENVEVTCNFSSPPPKRFFEKHSKRTRGNGHKKQQEIFQSDARKKKSSDWGWSNFGPSCLARLWDLHLQRYLQLNQMSPHTTWHGLALRIIYWNHLLKPLPT